MSIFNEKRGNSNKNKSKSKVVVTTKTTTATTTKNSASSSHKVDNKQRHFDLHREGGNILFRIFFIFIITKL